MSESWKEVLDALPDEEDRMAVLIGVIRFETRKEKILELLRYSMDISAKASLARELVEGPSFAERRRRHQEQGSSFKLPFDILSEIALVFSMVQENGAWPFSGICRAWREAVLSTPRAWTNIHLRAKHSSPCDLHWYNDLLCTCTSRMPDPALCIQRAGIRPIRLELHEPLTSTSTLKRFFVHIMPHVQHLYIHESTGSRFCVARSIPKLKELLIMRSLCTTSISNGDFKPSSILLHDLLGPATQDESARTLNRLQVARFDEIIWQNHHLAAFKQLRTLTLINCRCRDVGELHELLQNNCKTLEYLHLSISPIIMSESQEFQPVRLPRLRKLSFFVGRQVQNPSRSYQVSTPFIVSHAISFFQSLLIPGVTELQVFAPCIQGLDLKTRCPSLRHLHLIIPETIDDIQVYVQDFYSLLTTTPMHAIDLFIATGSNRLLEVKYNMSMALWEFLHRLSVVKHPHFASFTLKSSLDFRPLECVRTEWTQAAKRLHISKATRQECQNYGFKILEDVIF